MKTKILPPSNKGKGVKKKMKKVLSWLNLKILAAFCAVFGLLGAAIAEGTVTAIDISTDDAESVKLGLVEYLGKISPMVLTILASGIGIGLLFWVVRLFLRGTKATSR